MWVRSMTELALPILVALACGIVVVPSANHGAYVFRSRFGMRGWLPAALCTLLICSIIGIVLAAVSSMVKGAGALVSLAFLTGLIFTHLVRDRN